MSSTTIVAAELPFDALETQGAPLRHRLVGVGDEIGQDLGELATVADDRDGSDVDEYLDAVRMRRRNHDLVHEIGQLDLGLLQLARPDERRQVVRQRRRLRRLAFGQRQVLLGCRRHLAQVVAHDEEGVRDRRQRIAELVTDHRGHLADRRQPLALDQDVLGVLELLQRCIQVGRPLLDEGLRIAMTPLDGLRGQHDDQGDEQTENEKDQRPGRSQARHEGCLRRCHEVPIRRAHLYLGVRGRPRQWELLRRRHKQVLRTRGTGPVERNVELVEGRRAQCGSDVDVRGDRELHVDVGVAGHVGGEAGGAQLSV